MISAYTHTVVIACVTVILLAGVATATEVSVTVSPRPATGHGVVAGGRTPRPERDRTALHTPSPTPAPARHIIRTGLEFTANTSTRVMATRYPSDQDYRVHVYMRHRLRRSSVAFDDSTFYEAVEGWFADQAGSITTHGNISFWDVSAVTTMEFICAIEPRRSFNDNISGWDVSRVTSMRHMLSTGNKNTHGVFNQRIGSWDTSQVTTMMSMLQGQASGPRCSFSVVWCGVVVWCGACVRACVRARVYLLGHVCMYMRACVCVCVCVRVCARVYIGEDDLRRVYSPTPCFRPTWFCCAGAR